MPIDHRKLSAEWDSWLASLSPEDRADMAKQGLTGHMPDNYYGNTSPEIDRWLADKKTESEPVTDESGLSKVLLNLTDREYPGLDILCLLLVLRHPAAKGIDECSKALGLTKATLSKRGRRTLGLLDDLTRSAAQQTIEMLSYIAQRPNPRMSIYCALRAVGEPSAGDVNLEQIAGAAGLTKQNAHREVRVIKRLFGLEHQTRYEKDDETRNQYRLNNARNRTRIEDLEAEASE